VLALRDGALVFDGPASALTPAFLRELYGTSADELIDAVDAPAVDASPPILPILSRSIP
jgi:phosphonate transport system ATP-binding protein